MTSSPIAEVQPPARRDIDAYVLWLRGEAGAEVAERFARPAIASFVKLASSPMIGPTVKTRNARLAGLRKWKIDGFPRMLIFYIPASGGVKIIRVLHAAQDWWSLLDAD